MLARSVITTKQTNVKRKIVYIRLQLSLRFAVEGSKLKNHSKKDWERRREEGWDRDSDICLACDY